MGQVVVIVRSRAPAPKGLPPLPAVVEDRSWRQEAKCRSVGPDLFFPKYDDQNDSTRDLVTVRQAKQFCNGENPDWPGVCPVLMECALYAIKNEEMEGVWGGRSERERKRYAAELRKLGLL